MSKWLDMLKMKRITHKLFVITSLILLSFAVLIYVSLYFFLPTFYEQYKTDQLKTGIEEIITKSKELDLQYGVLLLDTFSKKNNANVYLQNKEGAIIYSPYFPSIHKAYPLSALSAEIRAGTAKTSISTNSYNVNVPIQYRDMAATLVVSATFQPIDEASQVLALFLPYISIIVIVIGIGSAYLYSRFITKPLLYINQGARKMAKLDFSEQIEVRSSDELGELSNSLNEMSVNLQQSMLDLQTANRQLKSDMEKEREAETKRREFFAIAAHELKTPLTVMKGYLEGMIYHIGPYQDRDQYLRKNHQIIEEMEKLVREILSMSRLERHTFKLQPEEVNVSQLVDTVTENLEFFAGQRDIQLLKQIDSNIMIHTDRILLEKACKNIIHNAIMYSPQGEKVFIRLTRNLQRHCLQFQVVNTGVSIKEEDLQHIFEPFFRIEKSRNRNTGGSGLGLYIVKQIFDALGISFSMYNIGQGVLFEAAIPLSE
ncbi:sensor histidine kinase [Paenibacillus alvei]|uniref:sensor histidine kinase n=1 Tax=Paenibacillus alvei TaxID=44250 RepID=UPI001F505C9A|nr:HAMP domain-containing sensor histidine kinase [Paenibacillus alvei]MBG9737671.1 histidine kinase [Paenibacillus alvei]MBG9747364.1 histidine kinase [Paenibacillus alvei]MCY9581135.1 HAMP domain-containing histidine kinase [Paenibacillus alvei]MCY9584574.1 HAMP domain-containing histidine kinase [Paenibacillus alvei]